MGIQWLIDKARRSLWTPGKAHFRAREMDVGFGAFLFANGIERLPGITGNIVLARSTACGWCCRAEAIWNEAPRTLR